MARNRLAIAVGIVAFAAITCQLVGFFTPGWMRMWISKYDREFLLSGQRDGPFYEEIYERIDEWEDTDANNGDSEPPPEPPSHGGDPSHHPPPQGHGGHEWPHGGGGHGRGGGGRGGGGRGGGGRGGGGRGGGGHSGRGHGPHGHHGPHSWESSEEDSERKKRQASGPRGPHDPHSWEASEEDSERNERQADSEEDIPWWPDVEDEDQDPTKVQMYITIGLWFTKNCTRPDKDNGMEHHRRHHHHHCCNRSSLNTFLDDVANKNMMDTIFTSLRDQDKKTGNTSKFFRELRVTATIGVVLGVLGLLSVICAFKCKKCRCSKYAAIFFLLLSGIFTLVPVSRISIQSHWVRAGLQWSQAVQGSLCFPYSVLLSGIGGVLSIMTVFGLLTWMCLKKRQEENDNKGLAYDNNMYLPTGDKDKVPGFLFSYPEEVAEPLPEKIPINDAVEPEK